VSPLLLMASALLCAAPSPEVAPAAVPPGPPTVASVPGPLSVALGVGLAVPVGSPSARFDGGPQASLALSWRLADTPAGQLGLLLQGAFASLPLDARVSAEPGEPRALTVGALTFGLDLRAPAVDALVVVAEAGLGAGAFSLGRARSSGPSLALQASLGLLWPLNPRLAVRLDAGPTVLLPFDPGIPAGGHAAVTLRAEGRF
jgi:hypothetical protein